MSNNKIYRDYLKSEIKSTEYYLKKIDEILQLIISNDHENALTKFKELRKGIILNNDTELIAYFLNEQHDLVEIQLNTLKDEFNRIR